MDLSIVLAIVFFVATVVLAVVLAVKFAKKRQPVWAYETTKLIGLGSNAPSELKLTFNEQSVTDVYRTRVILFNKGNEPILKGNVTESIAIHFKGANILRQPTILAKSRKGIELSAKQVVTGGDDAIEISFKYLDHNDGAVIEVLHTTYQDIKPSGNIIGTSEIHFIGEFAPNPDRPLRRTIMRVIMVLFGLGFALSLVLKDVNSGEYPLWIYIVTYAAVALFFLLMLVPEVAPFVRCRKFPRWSVIKS